MRTRRIRSLAALLFLPFAPLLSGCYYLQKTVVPLETLAYPDSSEPSDDLFVLLPGLGDFASAFEKRGVVEYLRSEDFAGERALDVVAVNAHFGYYQDRSFVDRVWADVIEPARARGQRVHLVGISLGGFGSLLILRDHGDEIASATLLAPYVGEEEYYLHLIDPDATPPREIEDKNLWPWLLAQDAALFDKVFLGYGERDKFAAGHRALATLLDPEHVVTRKGKHRWTVWREIWPELLPRVRQEHLPTP